MITKYSKLNHIDKITINKLKYVEEEALFTGIHADTDKVINKHLWFIRQNKCIGEFSLNSDKICLLSDGLKYFCKTNNTTIEKQIAKTISHEITHRILFYEEEEEACYSFDNIAESLKSFGVY